MTSAYPAQFTLVSDFDALIHTAFDQQMNAICWQRHLIGDFQEIVHQLQLIENITEVSIQDLMNLRLSDAGQLARHTIIQDIQQLSDIGALPALNLIKCYERDTDLDFISTDVYSYHVDRSPIATDTFLCTYYGQASEIIPNHQVTQKILIPEIRQQLKALYHGPESSFEDFLTEYFFDLHYQAHENANPTNLGIGHLWRLAVDHPQQQALPCVHRAPIERQDEYRLLLIC